MFMCICICICMCTCLGMVRVYVYAHVYVYEHLSFTYDFKSFLDGHLYKGFSGYGSSGAVHVLKFQRREGESPHISYKYWHQSAKWLPDDGSSLKILNTRPNLGDLSQLSLSPFVEEHEALVSKLKLPTLKWLQTQQKFGLVTSAQIASWDKFYESMPSEPTATFEAKFPEGRRFPRTKVRTLHL